MARVVLTGRTLPSGCGMPCMGGAAWWSWQRGEWYQHHLIVNPQMSGNHRQGQCLALVLEVRVQLVLHPGRCQMRDGPPPHPML